MLLKVKSIRMTSNVHMDRMFTISALTLLLSIIIIIKTINDGGLRDHVNKIRF